MRSLFFRWATKTGFGYIVSGYKVMFSITEPNYDFKVDKHVIVV